MALVQRANVILEIKDVDIDSYMNKGYNQIDEAGNIIRAAIPNDILVLRKAYVEHTALIKQLKEEIEKLSSKKTGRKSSDRAVNE